MKAVHDDSQQTSETHDPQNFSKTQTTSCGTQSIATKEAKKTNKSSLLNPTIHKTPTNSKPPQTTINPATRIIASGQHPTPTEAQKTSKMRILGVCKRLYSSILKTPKTLQTTSSNRHQHTPPPSQKKKKKKTTTTTSATPITAPGQDPIAKGAQKTGKTNFSGACT